MLETVICFIYGRFVYHISYISFCMIGILILFGVILFINILFEISMDKMID